jgi:hypothetical protein
MLEAHAARHLASGALVRVLEDWCPPFAANQTMASPSTFKNLASESTSA